MRDVASKSADNASRLAALFHMMGSGIEGAISEGVFASASRIVGWHLNEARRFFGELALPPELANAWRLDAWLLAYCRKEGKNIVPAQKVQQYGPSSLRDRVSLENAARALEELNRARMVRDGRARYIEVNPHLAAEAILAQRQ